MAQVFSRISPQYRQLILPHVRVVIVASPSSPPVVAPSLAPLEVLVAPVNPHVRPVTARGAVEGGESSPIVASGSCNRGGSSNNRFFAKFQNPPPNCFGQF